MTAEQIIKHYGGKTKAARALDLTLQTLRNWKRDGIPVRSQMWIQALSSGALKATWAKDILAAAAEGRGLQYPDRVTGDLLPIGPQPVSGRQIEMAREAVE